MKMNMKKYLALVLALALVFALAACGGKKAADVTPTEAPTEAAAEPTETPAEPAGDLVTVEAGKLHMSTNAAFPPYEMVDDTGAYIGIDVEVATAIAQKLGLELVVDDMDFDAALMAVQQGQSDIAMAGITVKPERAEVMDFSNTYAKGVQVVIVKEGSAIATVDDLANAELIGTQRGTTGYEYCLGDYGEEHVVAYDNGATAVQALMNGQVDCVVIDNEPAKAFVAANAGLTILDTTYADEDYAIAVQKGNTQLLDAVNQAIAELQEDGTFQAIVDKYIKAE